MIEALVAGYEQAFSNLNDTAQAMPKVVGRTMRQALGRQWRHLSNERINGETTKVPLGKNFWPLSKIERKELTSLIESEQIHGLVTMLRHRDSSDTVRFVDAAYWVKGCSSLGRLRYAVIVGVGSGSNEELCLLDIKEAATAAAPRDPAATMPRLNGERVVTGAFQLSPSLGARMRSTQVCGKSIFVRELMPQDLKIDIEALKPDEAILSARYLAHVLGQSHALQMDLSTRKQWRNELQKNRTKSLDAPSWIWNSVVNLIGIHETAYLNHCRRYANITET